MGDLPTRGGALIGSIVYRAPPRIELDRLFPHMLTINAYTIFSTHKHRGLQSSGGSRGVSVSCLSVWKFLRTGLVEDPAPPPPPLSRIPGFAPAYTYTHAPTRPHTHCHTIPVNYITMLNGTLPSVDFMKFIMRDTYMYTSRLTLQIWVGPCTYTL